MVYVPCKTYNGKQIHAYTITLAHDHDQSDEEYLYHSLWRVKHKKALKWIMHAIANKKFFRMRVYTHVA